MKKSLMITAQIWISALFIMQTSFADDIEIYRGGNGSATPNVLFVMDTSRSMSRMEITSLGPFNAATRYPVPLNGYDPDGIYLSRPAGALYDGDGSTDTEVRAIRGNRIHPATIQCPQLTQSLAAAGKYIGEIKYWKRGSGWRGPIGPLGFSDLINTGYDSADIVICQNSPYLFSGSNYTYLANDLWDNNAPYTNSWIKSLTWNLGPYYTRAFTGNYLNYQIALTDENAQKFELSRMVISREAAKDAVASVNGINLGLMKFDTGFPGNWASLFDGGEGGFVDIPLSPVADMRDEFKEKIDKYFTWGATPLEESYHEAFLYLTGKTPKYGLNTHSRVPGEWIDRSQLVDKGLIISDIGGKYVSTPSVPESLNGGRYKQPTVTECTTTDIVLFTDGFPQEDTSSNSAIQQLTGKACSGNGQCADDLALYMANNDMYPDVDGSQTIRTHTIGSFLRGSEGNNARTLLQNIARNGNGKYIEANDYATLRKALEDLLSNALETPSTFTAPTVAVNAYNSFESSDELYFSVFKPSGNQQWGGNLKRYKMGSSGEVLSRDGSNAIGDNGFFKDTALSYWTLGNEPDGNNVAAGGAASRLGVNRKILVAINGKLLPLSQDLTEVNHQRLGIQGESEEYRQRLINWALGINEDGTARARMEDPVLHYGTSDSTVFVATNSGFLHAFSTNTDNPEEHFAFVPEELLSNFEAYYRGGEPTDPKRYGLDGAITHWHDDKNQNGKIDGSDKVYLYAGMRRGGHSYYALDITDRKKPELLWQIHGRYPSTYNTIPSATSGYERLGQSWSSLIPAEVNWNGQRKIVLFTGGGYDADEDGNNLNGPTSRLNHDQGNTIYMIDAATGQRLWSAYDHAALEDNMTSSFPADVVPIDRDDDGLVDLIYAADVGGRIWRFDINGNNPKASNFAKGGVIADINDGSSNGNRRFYNAPDISYYSNNGNDFVLISVGSGYRAHPLYNGVQDYHFLIKDHSARNTPDNYKTLKLSDLKRWGSGGSEHGWFVELQATGEKALSPSTTLKGYVAFTTFAPNDPAENIACDFDTGDARLYTLYIHEEDEQDLNITELDQPTIPPSPVVVLRSNPTSNPDGNNGGDDPGETNCESFSSMMLIGPEAIGSDVNRCDQIQRTYWLENRGQR